MGQGQATNIVVIDRYEQKPFDSEVTKEIVTKKGQMVSECMLGNSVCTVAGVCVGTALGIQRKNLRPFVKLVTLGTIFDLGYGYTGNCRTLIDDYNHAKASYAVSKEKEEGING